MLLDCSGKTERVSEEVLEAIIAGFEFACKDGPLCGEPLRHVKVNLVDFQLCGDFDSEEIMRGVGKAIFGSFLTLRTRPFGADLQNNHHRCIGISRGILKNTGSRRGKVTLFEQKGLLTVISGFIPVSETFGFSKELRSATSGRAFWQMFFDHWEKMPPKLSFRLLATYDNAKVSRQRCLNQKSSRSSNRMQLDVPFDLDFSVCCGQVFRWKKMDGWWYGVVGENVVKIRQ